MLGLADRDGHVDAAALYDLGAAVGLSETTIRLTLKRLRDAHLVTIEGRGRRSEVTLTERGLAERAPDVGWTAMAYRIDAGRSPWDRRWHLVAFEIPETKRVARDALRDQLVELAGARLGGGLYVSPHPWHGWAREIARHHGIEDHVTLLTSDDLVVGGHTDPTDIARALWPLEQIEAMARSFVDRWSGAVGDPPSSLDAAAQVAFGASADLEALLERDPLLPLELMNDDPVTAAARSLYRRLLTSLSSEHPTLERANTFQAFLNALDDTEDMTPDEFGRWLRRATRPLTAR